MSKHTTKCETCGCRATLMYGGQDFGWTGICSCCKSLYQFVPNEEVEHYE